MGALVRGRLCIAACSLSMAICHHVVHHVRSGVPEAIVTRHMDARTGRHIKID